MAKSPLERPQGGALTVIDDDDPRAEHDPGALPDDGKQPAEVALSEVLAQLGEDEAGVAKCIVWRVATDARGDDEWLYEVSAADFARRDGVGDICKRYGPGIYRIRVYSGGRIYTHKRIKIGAPIIPDVPPGSDVTALRAEVAASLGAFSANFEKAIEKLAAAQPKPLSLREQLGDMVALKDFIGGGGARPASALSQVKEMAELIGALKSLIPATEGGGMGNAMLRLGEKYLPQIIETVQKLPVPGGAAPVAPVAREIAEAPEGDDMGALRDMQLKWALNFLIDSAARNLPAETYADLAIDKVPVPELNRLLNRADWLSELNKLDIRVMDHQAWFTQLRDEILATLKEHGALTAPAPVTTLEGGSTKPPSNVS